MVDVIKLGIKRPVTRPLLPDPEPRPVKYTLISVDDHLMEPPHTFEGRLPREAAGARAARRRDRGRPPGLVDRGQALLPGRLHVRGGPLARGPAHRARALRRDAAPAAGTSDARIRDMDINGIWASVNFPSGVTGFGGTLFSQFKDQELGLACVRAWNDWLFEEWYSALPRAHRAARHHATSRDPEKGAEEIRRNAKRGFTAVTMPEQPHNARAAARCSTRRTGTRSSARAPRPKPCSTCTSARPASRRCRPAHRCSSSAPRCSARWRSTSCAEWLWSGLAGALPRAEDRDVRGRHRLGRDADRPPRQHHGAARATAHGWPDKQHSPTDVLQRNFWFCMIDDPSTICDAPPHRRREHPVRVRLPARRRHLARHAGA